MPRPESKDAPVTPPNSEATVSRRNVALRKTLEELYAALNHRREIHPDPLEVVYHYENNRDREVVGLIASALAYGRVAHILQNLARVLDILGPQPHRALLDTSPAVLRTQLAGFQHRWTTAQEVVEFLLGIRDALRRHGSLEACFLRHHDPDAETTSPTLSGFVAELGDTRSSLLSAPEKGSACKRHHLYLRWMIRRDDVDPGCWPNLDPAQLIVPMDTHMHRVARALGMTKRKQANLATAMDTTRAFRALCPGDPVRYDFALTRLGIRAEMDLDTFLEACQEKSAAIASSVRPKLQRHAEPS